MPLPMVHLAVANELALRTGMPRDAALYYIGAIAPDGIHARAGATRDDKRRVHLGSDRVVPLDQRFGSIDALSRELCTKVDPSLLTGWVTHLVTDSVWSRHLVHGIWKDATRGWDRERRDRRYYEEADKVDFVLYRTVPWRSEVWRLIDGKPTPGFADLLTSDEIAAWRDRLLRWFTELKQEPSVEPTTITLERVHRFVEICVTVLAHGFETTFVDAIEAVPGIREHGLLRG